MAVLHPTVSARCGACGASRGLGSVLTPRKPLYRPGSATQHARKRPHRRCQCRGRRRPPKYFKFEHNSKNYKTLIIGLLDESNLQTLGALSVTDSLRRGLETLTAQVRAAF